MPAVKNKSAPELKPFALTATGDASFEAAPPGSASTPPKVSITAYTGGAVYVDLYYPYPAVIDLQGMVKHSERTPLFLDHDREKIVGQADRVEVTAKTIKLGGIITGNIEDENDPAYKVVTHARNGFVWPVSVGVRPLRHEYVAEGQKVNVNGYSFTGPIWIVRAGVLGEVSFVGFGADGDASAKVAASAAKGESSRDFSKWLAARGLDEATLTDEQKSVLQTAFNADLETEKKKAIEAKAANPPANPAVNPPASDADPVAGQRLLLAAESKRVAKIHELCAAAAKPDDLGYGALKPAKIAELTAEAIENGYSPERTELAIKDAQLAAHREERPKLSIVTGSGSQPINGNLIEAAAARTLGMPNIEKHYEPKLLEASEKRFKNGIALQEMLLHFARKNGFDGQEMRVSGGNIRSLLQASFSTTDIASALSNIANKFMLESFNAVESTWRRIARIRPVKDFKTITSYRLTGNLEYAKLAPTGEIQHGTLGNDSFTNKADTYAKMLGISRQDIINDDLGILKQVPERLGRGAALKINSVFWTEFLDNSSFFTSGNSNYMEDSTTNLSYAALEALELKFLNQTDQGGAPLAVDPKFLLVPNALWGIARTLYDSTEIRNTTSSTKEPTVNRFKGVYEPLKSSYLGNSAYTGYSTTAFYLIADPSDLAVMEICFLDGRETPVIESADADFDNLGIAIRGYHDFGAAKQEYRAGAKSKGAA